jgi:hypothetical protein
MVISDCSLVVTTFSKQTWPLQRIATRVISIVTFVDEVNPINSAHAEFMPPLAHAVLSKGVCPVLMSKIIFSVPAASAQSGRA